MYFHFCFYFAFYCVIVCNFGIHYSVIWFSRIILWRSWKEVCYQLNQILLEINQMLWNCVGCLLLVVCTLFHFLGRVLMKSHLAKRVRPYLLYIRFRLNILTSFVCTVINTCLCMCACLWIYGNCCRDQFLSHVVRIETASLHCQSEWQEMHVFYEIYVIPRKVVITRI